MICDRKIAVIVMLSDLMEGGHEASAQYWPSCWSYQYGEYTVELLEEEPLQGFIIRCLSVVDIKVCVMDCHSIHSCSSLAYTHKLYLYYH